MLPQNQTQSTSNNLIEPVPLYLTPEQEKEIQVARTGQSRSDSYFLDKLLAGYRWQLYVMLSVQSRTGLWGCVQPLRVRPEAGQASGYSDEFDILIGADSGSYIDIDVKSRTRSFTGPGNFPFPDCIIEPMSRHTRRSGELPDFWCSVSVYTGGMMFLSADTEEEWFITNKMGKDYVTANTNLWVGLDEFTHILDSRFAE